MLAATLLAAVASCAGAADWQPLVVPEATQSAQVQNVLDEMSVDAVLAQGKTQEAEKGYRRLLETATAPDPRKADAKPTKRADSKIKDTQARLWAKIGIARMHLWGDHGKDEEISEAFHKVLQLKPMMAFGYYGRAVGRSCRASHYRSPTAEGCQKALPDIDRAIFLNGRSAAYLLARVEFTNMLAYTAHHNEPRPAQAVASMNSDCKKAEALSPKWDYFVPGGCQIVKERQAFPDDQEVDQRFKTADGYQTLAERDLAYLNAELFPGTGLKLRRGGKAP
jgi:hypothetical protein